MKKTSERGYGNAHQKARRRALAALQEGEACPFCGRGMYRSQRLHFDHATPLALGGDGSDGRLAHASCNMRAGVRVREALRAARVYGSAGRVGYTSRRW